MLDRYLSVFAVILAVVFTCDAMANRVITGTKVVETTITGNKNEPNQEEKVKEAVTYEQASARMKVQIKELNSLMHETLIGTLGNSDTNTAKMIALNDPSNAPIALSSVVRVDKELEAENHARNLAAIEMIEKHKRGEADLEEIKKHALFNLFPVKTALKPTRLPSRQISLKKEHLERIHQPFVVIGSDEYSMAWFMQNLPVIRRFGANVLVTQVDNLTDFQAIQKLAPELQFQPVDASSFLSAVGVSLYPIIITNEGAIQ